ncbi:HNH endonuclease signature motif containing protein [Streptomyces sp. NPDC007369]|uniref:HNH endonuclease signature motif containing protein n=1 Tax=Streptomyces sp. NPDC007369 TaxID=3154589 RepID=UPI0033F63BAB
MRDFTDRFLAKVTDAEGGCWEWTGHIMNSGYGRFWLDGEQQYAHRVAYEVLRGPIPAGLVIDHLCRNRRCANPDHLEPVTNRTNILRGEGFAARRARQTHCLRGHLFDNGNTYVARNGTRKCRRCRANARSRRSQGVTCVAA